MQNFIDRNGIIEDLGIDNITQIKKTAAIAKAEGERDIQMAQAEAEKYAKEMEAEGIRSVGIAEAEAIKAKSIAEAEGIDKKTEAMAKMQEAAVLEMYFKALPEIVKNAAMPLANVDKITMYGEGNSAKLVKDIAGTNVQVTEGLKEAAGVDIKEMIGKFVGDKTKNSQEE